MVMADHNPIRMLNNITKPPIKLLEFNTKCDFMIKNILMDVVFEKYKNNLSKTIFNANVAKEKCCDIKG